MSIFAIFRFHQIDDAIYFAFCLHLAWFANLRLVIMIFMQFLLFKIRSKFFLLLSFPCFLQFIGSLTPNTCNHALEHFEQGLKLNQPFGCWTIHASAKYSIDAVNENMWEKFPRQCNWKSQLSACWMLVVWFFLCFPFHLLPVLWVQHKWHQQA